MGDSNESKLYFDQDMERGRFHPFAEGHVGVFSSRCPTKSTSNEDAAGLVSLGNGTGVLIVADGMGGAAAGEQASRLAIHTLLKSLNVVFNEDMPLRAAILNGIEAANREVVGLGIGAATTLAVVEVQGSSIRTYHVGDSMILIAGQRGKVKLQTVSHSPVGYLVEAGMLNEREALHHEDRHLVSNMIGLENMRIEVGPTVKLAARDTLLLASDGLFDNLHIDEIVQHIRKGPMTKVVRHLSKDASQRMKQPNDGQPSKCDDLTFVAFRPHAASRQVKATFGSNGHSSA